MANKVKITSPVDNSILAERMLATDQEIRQRIQASVTAQKLWAEIPLGEKARLCSRAIDSLVQNAEEIGLEITRQMGRPVQYAADELKGVQQRAQYMIEIAQSELDDINVPKKTGYTRFIRRTPLGVVLTIAPWNYPYLTAVNSVIPALMAGNTVILKHSTQTLLCAERYYQAFKAAGLPEGVFQYLHLDHKGTAELIQQREIAFISFTGSVAGGKATEQSAAGRFKGVALELGGKDPAYVCENAPIIQTVEKLADGSFYNSGQSCCGVKRVYAHTEVYQEVVEQFIHQTKQYHLGNPLDPQTTLGPMVNSEAADKVRQQIRQAVTQGATPCINSQSFAANKIGTPYMAPQVLINVNHSMDIMGNETFGPLVSIMEVDNDEQAIRLMNDSHYGLTASLWTPDTRRAIALGDALETGTVFMNRCDYLDPALAWVGVKDSGRGCALSILGYQQLTRPKSFHLKTRF